MKNWRTTAQIAEALGVSDRRVLQLAALRGVEGHKFGRAYLWPPGSLRKLKPKATGRPRGKA